jgi:hypothetical protein
MGSRNRTTLAVEALLDGEAETLTRKAIELAKAGDLAALRVCLDRIAPPRKDRPVLFELPPVRGIVNPSVAAVLLLMTRSNLVGCSTGRSSGLVPFNILSTNLAACR